MCDVEQAYRAWLEEVRAQENPKTGEADVFAAGYDAGVRAVGQAVDRAADGLLALLNPTAAEPKGEG